MKDFEEINFDSPRDVVEELRAIGARLRGIADHVEDPSLNNLEERQQRDAEKLAIKLEDQADSLLGYADSFLNGLWHNLHQEEKAQLLKEENFEA